MKNTNEGIRDRKYYSKKRISKPMNEETTKSIPFKEDESLPQNAREVGLTKYDSEHIVHIKKKIQKQVRIAINKLQGRKDQLMKLNDGTKASEGNPAALLLGKLFKQVEKALPTFVNSDEEIYKVAERVVEKNIDLDPFSIKNKQKRQAQALTRENKILKEYIMQNTPQQPEDVSIIEIIADEVNETLSNLPEVRLASEVLSEDELKKLFSPLAKQVVVNVHGQIEEKIRKMVEMDVSAGLVAAMLAGQEISEEDKQELIAKIGEEDPSLVNVSTRPVTEQDNNDD